MRRFVAVFVAISAAHRDVAPADIEAYWARATSLSGSNKTRKGPDSGDGPRDRAPIDAHFYALERLTCAVEVLVSGTDRVQERLIEAARSLQSIRPEEMPEGELRRVFAGVKDDLTFEPPVGSEGAIIATLLRTPDEDASAIAGRIFLLYRELYDHLMH